MIPSFQCFLDPDSLIPDPDPAFLAEYQSGFGSGSRVFMAKNVKKILQLKKKYYEKIATDSSHT
jgi:hypothetical protein